jgi:hypothetical protein
MVDIMNSNDKVVLLNGKIVKTALLASVEEGWVEIPDIASMAPLDTQVSSEIGENEVEPLEELKTKRLFGKVEIKTIKHK